MDTYRCHAASSSLVLANVPLIVMTVVVILYMMNVGATMMILLSKVVMSVSLLTLTLVIMTAWS